MEIIGIWVLVGVFALATIRNLNMGALALAAAFATGGIVYDQAPEAILAGFPASLLVVLVGVTFLFGIARANGTVDWLVHAAIRLVGHRVGLIPWVLFVVTAGLAAAGAASPAAVAIVAPIGITFGLRYGLHPLYVGLMVVNGAAAGSYAPTGILGGIVNGTIEQANFSVNSTALFLGNIAFGLLVCLVTWAVFGRRSTDLASAQPTPSRDGDDLAPTSKTGGSPATATKTPVAQDAPHTLGVTQTVTLAGIATLVIGTVLFDLDTGFLALTVAVVIALVSPRSGAAGQKDIAWPVILLVCGIVTYVTMLDNVGVVEWLGVHVASVGVPLIAALLICYIGGIVSAFASTTGIIAVLVPLAIPLLESGALATTGFLIALSTAATVVDASPFSTNGALLVANSPEDIQSHVYRSLLLWGAGVTAIAPGVAWLMFIVLGG